MFGSNFNILLPMYAKEWRIFWKIFSKVIFSNFLHASRFSESKNQIFTSRSVCVPAIRKISSQILICRLNFVSWITMVWCNGGLEVAASIAKFQLNFKNNIFSCSFLNADYQYEILTVKFSNEKLRISVHIRRDRSVGRVTCFQLH